MVRGILFSWWLSLLIVFHSVEVWGLDFAEKKTEVMKFLTRAIPQSYTTRDGYLLGFLYWPGVKGKTQRSTVIVPGRAEISYQYAEMVYDLRQLDHQGDFYVWDPKGQGLSERLLKGRPQVGHIEDFSHYSRELAIFLKRVAMRNGKKPYLIGHSLGGAISLDTVISYENLVESMALITPMLGLSLHKAVDWLAKPLIHALSKLGLGTAIVLGEEEKPLELQREFSARKAKTNSEERAKFRYWIKKKYGGHLPGITLKWMSVSLDAIRRLHEKKNELSLKTLIFIGSEDEVVVSERAKSFCQPTICQWIELNGRHALHEELDFKDNSPLRQRLLQEISHWIKEDIVPL